MNVNDGLAAAGDQQSDTGEDCFAVITHVDDPRSDSSEDNFAVFTRRRHRRIVDDSDHDGI